MRLTLLQGWLKYETKMGTKYQNVIASTTSRFAFRAIVLKGDIFPLGIVSVFFLVNRLREVKAVRE